MLVNYIIYSHIFWLSDLAHVRHIKGLPKIMEILIYMYGTNN